MLADPAMLVGVDISEHPAQAVLVEEILRDRRLTDRVRMYWNTDQNDRGRLQEIIDSDVGGAVDLVIDDASHHYVPTRTSFEALFPSVAAGGEYIIEDWSCDGEFAGMMAAPQGESPWLLAGRPGDPWQVMEALLPDVLIDPGHQAHAHVAMMLARGLASPEGPLGEAARELLARASAAGVTQQLLDRALERPQAPLSRLVLQLVLLHEVRPDIVSHIRIEASMVRVTRGPTALGADFSLGTPHSDLYGQLADWPSQRAVPPSRG